MRAFLLAVLPACSLYFGSGPTGSGSAGGSAGSDPHWVTTRAIAGEHQVAGIDSDGAGGLWIVYAEQPGGYGSLEDVWVTHLDASLAKVSEWYLHDESTPVSGLAYTGNHVWINYYGDVSPDQTHLRALDPTTGATLATVSTEYGIVDLAYGDGQLLLSNQWNQVVALDEVTGTELWRAKNQAFTFSTQRGIAYADGEIWISNLSGVDIDEVDDQGVLDAELWISAPLVDGSQQGMQLAWDGSQLLLAANGQIMWLARSD